MAMPRHPGFISITSRCFFLTASLVTASIQAADDPQAPNTVNPGPPPSDAVVLFDGQNLSKWRGEEGDPRWKLQAISSPARSRSFTTGF
jgi:hypothetical protein